MNRIWLKTLAPEVFRALMASGVAFLLDLGTLTFLTYVVKQHYLIAACAGFAVGLVVNYALSTAWVFTERRGLPVGTEALVFSGVGIVGLGLTELLLYTLTDGLQVPVLLSKVAAAGIVFLWNYYARRVLLFTSAS